MNGVPSQCRTFQSDLEELRAEKASLQGELANAAGPEKWTVLRAIGAIDRRIVAATDRLNDCVRLFGHPYRVDVVLSDLVPGGSVMRPVTGHLWYFSPPAAQTLAESVPAQNDRCTFVRSGLPPSGSIGLSVDEDGSGLFDGPLFRSGSFSQLPTASAGRPAPTVEIVAPAAVTIPPSAIAAPTSIPGVALNGPASITLGSGVLTFTFSGTTTVSLYPTQIELLAELLARLFGRDASIPTANVSFTCTLSVDVVPSENIGSPARACALRRLTEADVTGISDANWEIRGRVAQKVTYSALEALETTINDAVMAAIGGAVPPNGVLSLRKCILTGSGLRVFPAVGRFLP